MHSVFQVQQIRGISHPQHGRGGRNHGHVRYDDSKRVQKHDSGQRNGDLSRAMDRRTLQHRILHDRGICTLTHNKISVHLHIHPQKDIYLHTHNKKYISHTASRTGSAWRLAASSFAPGCTTACLASDRMCL